VLFSEASNELSECSGALIGSDDDGDEHLSVSIATAPPLPERNFALEPSRSRGSTRACPLPDGEPRACHADTSHRTSRADAAQSPDDLDRYRACSRPSPEVI
jgi:hypothetical protein